MPDGSGLKGDNSSAQSALIVPMPCDPSHYYLFTADQLGYTAPNSGIHYSIVDMRQDSGMGDVVVKNIQILEKASEHLTAVMHQNGHDYWVITHSNGGRTFYAFLVDAKGISTMPVESVVGTSHGEPEINLMIGYLKGSPDGTRIALAGVIPPLVELYDFDPATGRVSNPLTLIGPDDTYHSPYGISFSPDGSRLYVGSRNLTQWSLDAGGVSAIKASGTIVSDTTIFTDQDYAAIQIGPDGRIYFLQTPQDYIGIITNPDAPGRACGVIDTAMRREGQGFGLPNNIDTRSFFTRPYSFFDTTSGMIICVYGDTCSLSNRGMILGLEKYALYAPNPNPFNPATEIRFTLGLDGPTRLEILDVTGKQVALLIDDHLSEGDHSITWNSGAYPSGLYYCRLQSGEWSRTVSMLLVK
jgi:hypothetical protein